MLGVCQSCAQWTLARRRLFDHYWACLVVRVFSVGPFPARIISSVQLLFARTCLVLIFLLTAHTTKRHLRLLRFEQWPWLCQWTSQEKASRLQNWTCLKISSSRDTTSAKAKQRLLIGLRFPKSSGTKPKYHQGLVNKCYTHNLTGVYFYYPV